MTPFTLWLALGSAPSPRRSSCPRNASPHAHLSTMYPSGYELPRPCAHLRPALSRRRHRPRPVRQPALGAHGQPRPAARPNPFQNQLCHVSRKCRHRPGWHRHRLYRLHQGRSIPPHPALPLRRPCHGKDRLHRRRGGLRERRSRRSPDSQTLAFTSNCSADKKQDQIFLYSRATGESKQLTHVTGLFDSVAFSPDGHGLAFLFVENATRSAERSLP